MNNRFPYIFTEEAQREYEDSLRWYLARNKKAAFRFANAVDQTLQLICEHPYRWRNSFGRFYELSVRKFPFSVVYTIENDENIVVMAVFHHKRNPSRKYRIS